MTQWVDNFFGNDERDLEQAYSRLRLRTIYDWDDRLDNEIKVRLGGKVSLPQISDRLDLVFRGEDMDGFNDRGVEDADEDRIGLQYEVGPADRRNGRFKLTVGFGSSGPKPGVKYVYQDALAEDVSFRFTQRFTYDLGDGGYGSSRFVVDKALRERELDSRLHALSIRRENRRYRVVNQLVLRPGLGRRGRPRWRELVIYRRRRSNRAL